MFNIHELIDIISLETIDKDLYRAKNYKTPWGRIFGGQVLAQALHAAYKTVPENRIAHSFHGYFILAGDVNIPVIYQVSTLRDGGSFSTRRVTAKQNGKAIFIMAASFHTQEEGFEHQSEMPQCTPPEDLLPDYILAEKIKDISPEVYMSIMARRQNAIDFRPDEKSAFGLLNPDKIGRKVWLKSAEKIEVDLPMKQQILAYASDYDLLLTAVFPHRKQIENPGKLFLASLDHAMWFHRDFDINNWILFDIDSPSAINSRGMGYGNMYSRDGKLICSLMQEGLIRSKRK